MRIFGIGIDVVEVERIARVLADGGDRFKERVFTAAERDYCEAQLRPELHYAARFAAKEAVAKAFGTGIGGNLALLDMEITHDHAGAPRLKLTGDGKTFAAHHQIREVMISMSHSRAFAAANAVAVAEQA